MRGETVTKYVRTHLFGDAGYVCCLFDGPIYGTKGSLKNNFTFYPPIHPAWLRCESSEYAEIQIFLHFRALPGGRLNA